MKIAKKQVFDDINITPLTDIFLVLLIIMMVVAPMLEASGIKLSVPAVEASSEVKEQPKTITLSINAQDQYDIDGQVIAQTSLTDELKRRIKEKPDGLIIESNPQASHNALAMAMDAAQTANISKVAVTEKQQDAAGQ